MGVFFLRVKIAESLLYFIGVFILCGTVFAAEINLTMEYKSSVFSPGVKKFTNTTPQGSFCASRPLDCKNGSVFTVNLPIKKLSYGAIKANTNSRQSAFYKIPSNTKIIQVKNTKTQHVANLRFRLSGLGIRVNFPVSMGELVEAGENQSPMTMVWGYWYRPEGGCSGYGGSIEVSTYFVRALWLYPDGVTGCYKIPKYNIPSLDVRELGLMYEMIAPDPFELGNGVYTGSVDYSVGPGKDFDFGDNSISSDSNVRINFTLTVQHELKVFFPPELKKVVLEPPNGWQVWMQQGRPPVSLKRDIPFSVASSANFSMRLECQYRVGESCGIRNKNNTTTVPVEMAVTIQGTKEKQSGKNIEHWLLTNALQGPVFFSDYIRTNRQSVLHFEVKKASVDQMIKRAGDQYKGNITVIFDALSL